MKGGQLSDKVGELRATGVTNSGSRSEQRERKWCNLICPGCVTEDLVKTHRHMCVCVTGMSQVCHCRLDPCKG